MSKEVALQDPKDLEMEPHNMMAVLARAAADPRIDVAKLQALLDMQFKVEARQAEVEFNAALARLMPKLPRIQKNGVISDSKGNVRSRFARFEDIDREIRPLLAEEGLAISFDTDTSTPGFLKVVGTLSHRMGFSKPSQLTIPTASQVITGAQAIGAAASFGKRYVVINLLNIICVGEDTDGHDPTKISSDQALTLDTLLKDTGANRAKFIEWMGVASIEEILAKDYDKAVKALEAKRRQ